MQLLLEMLPLALKEGPLVVGNFVVIHIAKTEDFVVERLQPIIELRVLLLQLCKVDRAPNVLGQLPIGFVLVLLVYGWL